MNIYQTITDRILKQLESGVVPWRKTWTTGLPKSLTTAKEYRGINIVILGMAEYTSRYWVTYRQAQHLGGQVRKGERSTPVIYWKWRTPAYCPGLDRVLLPHLSQFEDAHAYYYALYHELVHSTGHPRRLKRFEATGTDGFSAYSFEELVAEFGAAFLAAFAGIQTPDTDAQNASYIAGWAEAIRNDNRLILLAASAAQRAADYIRGKLPAGGLNPVESGQDVEPEPAPLAVAS
jgi:antirestriction protein ArdC